MVLSQVFLVEQVVPAQRPLLVEPLILDQSISPSTPTTNWLNCQLAPTVPPATPPLRLKSPELPNRELVQFDVPKPQPPLMPT